MALFKELNAQLGWRYPGFLAFHALAALVTLLPISYFIFLTTQGLNLSEVTPVLLRQVAWLGLAVAVIKGLTGFCSTVLGEVMRVRIEWQLRRALIQRLSQLSLSRHELSAKDSKYSRIRHDLRALEDLLVETLPQALQYFVIILTLTIVFLFQNPMWSLAILVTGGALFLGGLFVQRLVTLQLRRLRFIRAAGLELLLESLDGLRTIRSHGMEPYVQRRFDLKQAEASSHSLDTVKSVASGMGFIEFLTFTAIVTFFGVALSTTRPGFLPVNLVLMVFSSGVIFSSVCRLSQLFLETKHALTHNGLFSLMKPSIETSHMGDLIGDERAAYRVLKVTDAVAEDREDVVGPVNFSIGIGQFWVISGTTSSGKTLLLETLAGLRCPTSGSVTYEDLNHRPLFSSSPGKLQMLRLTPPGVFVEQYPYLIEGTLRENLTFGNSGRLSDTHLWRMLERVGLFEVVQSWGGLDFLLKDRGEDLSRSERYRIALCRALLLKRPFIFLDEPFNHLDDASIEQILTTLKAELPHSTIFIAARSLPSGLQCDGCIQVQAESDVESSRVTVKVLSSLHRLTPSPDAQV